MATGQSATIEQDALAVSRRLADLDWKTIEDHLWTRGYAKTGVFLTRAECDALVKLYPDDARFRSRVEMVRYAFGLGEYKYFALPLPAVVDGIRAEAYSRLRPIADRWMEVLGLPQRYPADLGAFLELCAQGGQRKPAPLLLKYTEGDYNCLHQDVLGDVSFPFQMTCSLSRKDIDYAGGEFLLVEQTRRGPRRGEVVTLEQGEFVIFTTDCRPAAWKRGYRSVRLWHGVSRITKGQRYSLGVIFHDSK